MGNKNGKCCSCFDKPIVIEEKTNFDLVYNAMKEIFLSLQYDKIELKNKYLIQTKSIPQFIEIIENSKIFDLIKDKKSDNDIINSQNYYNLKKNYYKYHNENNDIIFFDSYNDCEKLSKTKDDPDNEFIIVNANFIKKITKKKNYNLNGNVNINIDKYNSKMEINFPNSQKTVYFNEKRTGIYQCCEQNNEEKDPYKNFNPPQD